MRTTGAVVLGIVGGALAGLAASEALALLGLLLSDRPTGLRYLPVVLAAAGGATAWVLVQREGAR